MTEHTQELQQFLSNLRDRPLLPQAHVEYLYGMNISPKVVYDIGSCVLHWTSQASKVWPSAEFYLFEASPEVEFLYQNTPHEYHIGVMCDQDNKPVTFYKDMYNAGGNSYYMEQTGHYNQTHGVDTLGMTLSTVVRHREFPMPDLIKMDVQGAELDIMTGALDVLGYCQDIILEAQHTDYNRGAPKAHQVIEFMRDHGYQLISNFTRTHADGDYHFRKS